jgi:hypothetical protein
MPIAIVNGLCLDAERRIFCDVDQMPGSGRGEGEDQSCLGSGKQGDRMKQRDKLNKGHRL